VDMEGRVVEWCRGGGWMALPPGGWKPWDVFATANAAKLKQWTTHEH